MPRSITTPRPNTTVLPPAPGTACCASRPVRTTPSAAACAAAARSSGRASLIYINQALAGEAVALIQHDEGLWQVRYGPIELGLVDHRGERLQRPKHKARGLVDNPKGLPTNPPAQQPTTDLNAT